MKDKANNSNAVTNLNTGVTIKPPQAKSFADDSWATIIENVRAGTTDAYKVGDTKEVTLNGFEGTFTLRIANKSTPDECSQEDFSQTACGFVIEFEDIITTHIMKSADDTNPNGTNVGGWPATELYDYLTSDIYNSLPEELKKGIKDTKVISGRGKEDKSNFTTMDKLYLLSPHEVWEDKLTYDSAYEQTRQLDYYQGVKSTDTGTRKKTIKYYNDTEAVWWLRDANYNTLTKFYTVKVDGNWFTDYTDYANGVAPAFRI